MAEPSAVLSILVKAQGVVKTQAELAKLHATSERTANSTEKLEKRFSHLDNTVGDFNRTMMAGRNAISLVKFPALIAGAGAAAQAVGALGGGVIALTGALGPASGALIEYAAGAAALGQGLAVVKLGLGDVGKALGGNKNALKALNPEQRAFLKDLKASKKEIAGLGRAASKGLLPGFSDALKNVGPVIDRLKPIFKSTGQVIGSLADQGARLVRSWGKDLNRVGRLNVQTIGALGNAALSLVDALKNVLIAGRPLVHWFNELIVKGASWVQTQAAAGRESGKMAKFFEHTRAVLTTLGHTIANVSKGLFNIFKGGVPLGNDMLANLEKLTKKFADWSDSTKGKNQISDFFKRVKGPLYEVIGLTGDLSSAIGRLLNPKDQSSEIIGKLRDLVPLLESVIANTTSNLAPVLIDTLAQFIRIFAAFAGSSGPLELTIGLVGVLAGAFADLLQAAPLLNQSAVAVLGLATSMKVLAVVAFPLKGVMKLLEIATFGYASATASATKYTILERVQLLALRAQEIATAIATNVMKVATIAWGVATKAATAVAVAFRTALMLINAAFLANPIGLTVLAIAALGAAFYLAYKKIGPFRDAVNFVWGLLKSVFRWAQSHWPLLVGILGGPFGVAAVVIIKHGRDIFDFFKKLPGRIVSVFSDAAGKFAGIGKSIINWIVSGLKAAANVLIGFLQKIVDVINAVIPGKGPIGAVPKFATGGKATASQPGKPGGAHGLAEGGKVTMPVAIMGEEAPTHPEWVIPTNPAYRSRAIGLWAKAAHDIGVPGFASGGLLDTLGSAGKFLVKGGASAITSKLPDTKGLGIMAGAGEYVLKKVTDWIKDKVAAPAKAVSGLFTGSTSVHGLLPRVLRAIAWARSHGWSGRVTSGYRSFAEQSKLYSDMLAGRRAGPVAVPGTSMHEKGAAIDVTDYPAFLKAMQSAPPDSRLKWFGPSDSVHFSITGRKKGGLLASSSFRTGGKFSIGGLKKLWVHAHGDPSVATLMAHIAMAESTGYPLINNGERPPGTGPRGGDGGRHRAAGLWQILGLPFNGDVYDAATNARMAVSKYNSAGGTSPWSSSRGAWGRWAGVRDGGGHGGGGGGGGGGVPHVISQQHQAITQGKKVIKRAGKVMKAHAVGTVKGTGKITGGILSKGGRTATTSTPDQFIDFYNAALSLASMTSGVGDDLLALRAFQQFAIGNLNTAKASGNSQSISAAVQTLQDVQGKISDVATGGLSDALSHVDKLVRAGDESSAQGRQDKIDILTKAINEGSFNGVALSPDDILDLRGDLKELTDTLDATTAAIQAQAEAQKALAEELGRQNDLIHGVQGITTREAVKALSDVISGQIMGPGYSNRALTASAGKIVRY